MGASGESGEMRTNSIAYRTSLLQGRQGGGTATGEPPGLRSSGVVGGVTRVHEIGAVAKTAPDGGMPARVPVRRSCMDARLAGGDRADDVRRGDAADCCVALGREEMVQIRVRDPHD